MCFADDLKDKELKFWHTKPNCFLVAAPKADPDKVLGFVAYQPIGTDTVEVCRMSVAGEARGIGLGKKLMQAIFQSAKEEGFTRFYLTTTNAQATAIKLYKKTGFKEIGREDLATPISKYLVPFNGLHTFQFLYEME